MGSGAGFQSDPSRVHPEYCAMHLIAVFRGVQILPKHMPSKDSTFQQGKIATQGLYHK